MQGARSLVLAAPVGRGVVFAAALAAIGAGVALLLAAVLAGLAGGGLAVGESAFLSLATVTPALVFAAVGAVTSQLAPTRRQAIEIGMASIALALALRVVADTSSGLEWLRWVTPLGWSEELRAFAGARPAVLLAPLAATAALLAAAASISARRDVGNGLLAGRDSAKPRFGLLSSPTALALRGERASLLGWLAGIGFFAFVVGLLADTFSTAHLSETLRAQIHKVGGASIVTPSGALGFYFLMFVLAISLFACAQIAAARHEESEQRLETLFALPVSRPGWLAGRLLLAAAAALALALAAGLLAWAGAASQGAGVSLPDLLEAGPNCMPATLLFLGLGALAFATAPRAAAGIAYGLVAVSFCWELFGALLDVPSWTLDLSPFHHVGLVPAEPFQAVAATAMVAGGTLAALAALRLFERRDTLGA